MRFTKTQMLDELSAFLALFGEQIASLYGASFPVQDTRDALHASPIWTTVSEMYDYGVDGLNVPVEAGSEASVVGRHIEVERFLHALDTLPMKLYLHGNGNAPPRLAIIAAKCAAARLVLDGGDRRIDHAIDEFGLGKGDFGYLTLAEVALLANMDERSVRNAANPKLPNHLLTEQVGRRSLVRPEEARRWLALRKGFVPTRVIEEDPKERLPNYDLELTPEFVEDVRREANELAVPFEIRLMDRILEAAQRLVEPGDEK